MDTKRFNYKSVLGVDPRSSKADMMTMMTSCPSHAMVINGVDMDPPVEGTEPVYRQWRIENSWGISMEMEWHPDHGCWQMSDDWFDKYVHMVVLDLKYFPENVWEEIVKHKDDKVIVKPWSVFGTVATYQGCDHCKYMIPLRSMKKDCK